MSIHETHADTDEVGAAQESPIVNNFDEKHSKLDDEKIAHAKEPYEVDIPGQDDPAPDYRDEEGKLGDGNAVETNEDLVTRVIHVEDDPSLNPWTFRVFFLGMCKTRQLPILPCDFCPTPL